MPTPRRRSSRLRALSPQKPNAIANTQLTALDEDEETGVVKGHDSPSVASPVVSTTQPNAMQTPAMNSIKTPTTAGRTRPSPEEMHPSRYQNTATKAASGKRLGIVNNQLYHASAQPREKDDELTELRSPRAAQSSPARQSFASPGFQFRFRQSTDMSSEAQRMMDEIREQAARIREGLATERDEQMRKEDEAENMFSRRMATPKGKMGRFSDVHMDQFKKMNSIANHASTFRADSSKTSIQASAPASKEASSEPGSGVTLFQGPKAVGVNAKSLKRTNSRAELDRPEPTATRPSDNESPAKRYKQQHEAGVAVRDEPSQTTTTTAKFSTTSIPRVKPSLPIIPSATNLTTPSKLPLARSASVKSMKITTTSATPLPIPFPSTNSLATSPATLTRAAPHTEGSKKYKTSLAQTFTKVKSILRPPQIRFSDDPEKIVAGTHLSTPQRASGTAVASTTLAPLPEQPGATPGTPSWRKEKHVNFSPSTTKNNLDNRSHLGTPTTPSPLKIPGSFPLAYPSLTAATTLAPNTPTHAGLGSHARAAASVRASVATPGDFTFRADQTLSFGPRPGGTPTIRRVRASDTAAFTGANAASKEGFDQLPHVPHGLSNKKRKRDSADKPDRDEAMHDDKENLEAEASDLEQRGSPAKKARVMTGMGATARPPPPASTSTSAPAGAVAKAKAAAQANSTTSASKIPKRKGGSVLSMSRLNALAKPRERR